MHYLRKLFEYLLGGGWPNSPVDDSDGWRAESRCAACAQTLSHADIFRSSGCCPRCGTVSEGSVVETTKHPYRLVPGGAGPELRRYAERIQGDQNSCR